MKASPSLLGIEPLDARQITSLLRSARRMARGRPRPVLRGRHIVLLFYEASTRTRVSFELAAQSLGATTYLVHATASSIEKGETLLDTGRTLRAIGADAIVIRHPSSGAPHLLAKHLDIPIINAGDGMHEHPSQALLDAYTILERKKRIEGLRVAVVGDIFHSRVARSDIHLLSRFGARLTLCGPPDLVPDVAVTLAPGLRVTRSITEALTGADIVMLLRVQKERFAGTELRPESYAAEYQLTPERLRLAKRDAIVMHPGPMIRGMEVDDAVADSTQAVILDQVRNGVAVRRAILAHVLGAA
ncbi:MAG TPA: aspartate carbamoyltransferase catalytic subunit [Terriglobales bacterium]|nr:aspartate carbamoyltransferase catalytic subunit [Terriglobales bacterium]